MFARPHRRAGVFRCPVCGLSAKYDLGELNRAVAAWAAYMAGENANLAAGQQEEAADE